MRPKTAAERLQRQTLGSGGIFKSAAVDVLRLERRLMSTGDIAKVALQRGLIKCQGKTPEATMASALYTDVKRKEGHSIFIRPHEGLFGLREWADKGLVFKVSPMLLVRATSGLEPSMSHVHIAVQRSDCRLTLSCPAGLFS